MQKLRISEQRSYFDGTALKTISWISVEYVKLQQELGYNGLALFDRILRCADQSRSATSHLKFHEALDWRVDFFKVKLNLQLHKSDSPLCS